MPSTLKNSLYLLVILSMLALPVLADRTAVKAGWTLFTQQQDVELGRYLANDAENVLRLETDTKANTYIHALGSQLAAHAPGEKYAYQFKIIDDDKVRGFALPGGYIYISRGAFETAQNEPELAAFIAHQIGHAVLRHGSQQISQAYNRSVPNARRASVDAVVNRLDLRFDEDSVALRYSREAERQADLIATQILFDAGFDPRQLANMFQKIEAERSNMTTDYFANHPTVANRAARVRTEISNMGGLRRNLRGDSPDFHSVKENLVASTSPSTIYDDRRNTGKPAWPSTRMVAYRGRDDIQFRYPDNWDVHEEGDSVTLAPEGGIVSGGLAYGMRMATFETRTGFFGQTPLNSPGARAGTTSLSRATDQLLDELRQSNPNMTVVRSDQRRRVDNQPAITMEIANDSPLGGRETNWLVTVLSSDGLLYYFIGAAPQRDFARYLPAFEQIVNSVQFTDY